METSLWTASCLSSVICISSSRFLTSAHTRVAISGPILGSPSAEMKVLKVIALVEFNSARTLLADFSAILSSEISSCSLSSKRYRSPNLVTSPDEQSCSASFSPIPSIPSFLHQYRIPLSSLDGQSMLVHLMNAPSIIRSVEHLGHPSGTGISDLEGSDSEKGVPSEWDLSMRSLSWAGPRTSVIFGITSPLLTTLTLSPIIIPSLSTSPLLWSVVFSTVTPETTTGATRETGVTLPVLPVCQKTSISTVTASSAGNFHASAHRG